MLKRTSGFLITLCAFFDMLLVAAAYYFSENVWLSKFAANSANIFVEGSIRRYVHMGVAAYAVLLIIAFAAAGVYKSQRLHSIWRTWIRMAVINAVFIGIAMAVFYTFRLQEFSRGITAMFFAVSSAVLLVRHSLCCLLLRLVRIMGYNLRHVIVIGGGELARQYIETINDNPRYGISVAGYLSEGEGDIPAHRLGGYNELEKCVAGVGIDEVIIADEAGNTDMVLGAIEVCERCGTRVSVIPYYNSLISDRPSINAVGGLKCFALRSSPLDNKWNKFIKRLFDIVFSAAVLVLLSPLMLIVAAMVKLTSPGPVIFKQARVGMDKKEFTMLKFRSMKVNSESNTAWSKDRDPRKTWFGSFIRKTSIDELPQFYNVLRGDMSIIGPRPEIPFYVEQYKNEIPKYMLKHLVRPGITGWAQVNGYRGDTSIAERIKHDIWYIENWSVKLDIKIMLMTVFGGMINKEKLGTANNSAPKAENK